MDAWSAARSFNSDYLEGTPIGSHVKPGNTPLVELRHLAPAGTRLFAKLEWYNPTGSIKDRAAWFMFHNAVEKGYVKPGMPFIEATSGNTGIGLARLALVYGYPMVICLPTSSTDERKQLLRAYGAELIEVDGGPNDAIAHARQLVAAAKGTCATSTATAGIPTRTTSERRSRSFVTGRSTSRRITSSPRTAPVEP